MRISTSGLLIVLALVSAIAIALTVLDHEVPAYHRQCDDVGYCPPSR